jgi:hypothetical protein
MYSFNMLLIGPKLSVSNLSLYLKLESTENQRAESRYNQGDELEGSPMRQN